MMVVLFLQQQQYVPHNAQITPSTINPMMVFEMFADAASLSDMHT